MKVTHIIPANEAKFMKGASLMFNSIDGIENEYLLCSRSGKIQHDTGIDDTREISLLKFKEIYCDKKSSDVIFIHSLGVLPKYLLSKIHPQTKVVWLSWGYDVYQSTFPEKPLVDLKERNIRGRFYVFKEKYANLSFAKHLVKWILFKSWDNLYRKREWLERIDYYSGVFPEEYDYIKNSNPSFRAKRIKFNYSSPNSPYKADDLYKDFKHERRYIQIGHSGNLLSKHLDIIDTLKGLDGRDLEILLPLSYGCGHYGNRVIKVAKRFWGNRAHVLTRFLPYNEYVELNKNVRVAIFNIKRQCGVGNIFLALWNGAKVFLPHDSLNFKHFKSLGYIVYSIEEELSSESLQSEASEEEIIHNRRLILKENYEVALKNLSNSIDTIKDDIFPSHS